MIKTILIVEDEQHFHNLYQTMLKDSEYKYVHAYDGDEALLKLEKKKPDLIILDILLDMMTGDTFFLYLKSMPEYADIPVIVVSSFPARKYKNLNQIDPGLVFLKKQYLTKVRLIDEVNNKISVTKKTNRVTFRLPEVVVPDAKSVCVVGDFNK